MEQVKETVAVHTAEIEHMKRDIDHIMNKVDQMDTKIDNIEKVLSELSGGKKMGLWIAGAIVTVVSFVVGHWMNK